MKKYCPNCFRADTVIPTPCAECEGSGVEGIRIGFDGCYDACKTCSGFGEQKGEFECSSCGTPVEDFIPENELDEYEWAEVADALNDPLTFLDEYERKMDIINAKRRNINNAAIVGTALLVGLATALVAYVTWGI